MKKPLNLKELPGYLERLRNGGEQDVDLVVDIGSIKDTPSPYGNFRRFAFIGAFCLFVAASSLVSYNLLSSKSITVVLDTNNISPQEFSNILSENGVNIVSVKQNGDSSYEVELKLRKSVSSFLEKLRNNKDIKKVDLK